MRSGTDVPTRLATGEVPQDFDEIGGEELPVMFKGPPLDLPPGFAWEWVSPTAAGWGDPLLREPADVAADVDGRAAVGRTTRGGCTGFCSDPSGAVDRDATAAARLDAPPRAARWRGAGRAGRATGGRRAGGRAAARRRRALVVQRRRPRPGRRLVEGEGGPPAAQRSPSSHPSSPAAIRRWPAKITLHAWYCPVTGYRLDLELARGDEPPLTDMVLFETG